MPSSSSVAEQRARGSGASFATRAEPEDLAEWMDEPCSYEDFRDCLRDLAQFNRLSLAHLPTLKFLDSVIAQRAGLQQTTPPLHIVDVGSGGGDMLQAIARWAQRRQVAVKLIGIDLNPYAARAAHEFNADANATMEWLTADAFAYKPSQPVDVVVSSLFTHHLPEREIVRFLSWMETTAQRGWFINDLRRSAAAFHLFRALAGVMRWHRFVRHDGPVSVRRSFREADWQRMVRAAELDEAKITLHRRMPARLCVSRLK